MMTIMMFWLQLAGCGNPANYFHSDNTLTSDPLDHDDDDDNDDDDNDVNGPSLR